MKRMLRAAGAGLVLGLGLVVIPAAVTAAHADPIGSCTTTTGAIVAVDFSHWSGPIVRGCGVNDRTGYALLHAAGFNTVGDNHDGPAFICRIGNQAFQRGTQYPTPAQDPCILTPPASAYWSYWLAPAGQNNWTYSQVGSVSHAPKPGEVELWTFGSTDLAGTTGSAVPNFSPDAIRAHNAAPTGGGAVPEPTPTTRDAAPVAGQSVSPASGPTPTNPTTHAPGGPLPTNAANTSGHASGAPAGVTESKPTGSTPTTTRLRGTSSVTTTTADASNESPGTPRVVSALPAVAEHHSSGSIAPLLIGIGLVALLAAGTAGAMLRRRRRLE